MFDFYKGLPTLFMERNGQISLNHPFYYTPPTHTQTHTPAQTNTHTHTHTPTPTPTHTHTHTDTQTDRQTDTHTHTQRHGIVMTFMSLNVKEKS